MKISKEFKVGSIIVIAILFLYWGVNFMKGNDLFQKTRYFYVVYPNTEGLTVAKPVNINGFKVGQVSEMYFHPDQSGEIVVKFNVESDYPIPDNSIAKIHSMSLLGEMAIAIELGQSFELAETGDTLMGDREGDLSDEVSKQVAPIKAKAEHLLGSLDTAVTLLTGFLNEQTRKNFTSTFVNLSETFENLEKTSRSLEEIVSGNKEEINSFIRNLSSISSNLENNNEDLSNIINNFSDISDTLAKADFYNTIEKLHSTLATADSIMQKVNTGEGSLGLLINDDKLYNNLEDAANSLDRLLLDIKYNPNKYVQFSVFGSKERFSEEDIDKIEEERKSKAEENRKETKEE